MTVGKGSLGFVAYPCTHLASLRGATTRGGPHRHTASLSTVCGGGVLRDGRDGGTQYPWHNRP